jgi:hypothetical protein
VIALAVFLALAALVALLSLRAPRWRRVQVRSCCGARPWPPDDLTGADADAGPRG